MFDKKARTAFGLALFVCAGLSAACNGWRDPISGHRVCRAAPPAIASWSRPGMGRTPGDLADLKAWVTKHADAMNAQYGGLCETPLHTAARLGREDIAALLLAHGANPDADDESGNTPVTTAASYGRVEAMKVLLARRVDVNRRGRNSRSPLVAAVSGLGVETDLDQRLEVARILIAAGADVNAREPSSGLTPLYYAAGMGTTHSEPMMQLLLAHGADVRAVAMQGVPLLTAAAGSGDRGAVQLLLDRGADVNATDKGGTALAAAAYGGHLEVVLLLLERGADVNRRVPGSRLDWDGLSLAAALDPAHTRDKSTMAARREVAELLIARGADVNATTYGDGTLLHRAAFEGDLPGVNFLISHGAVLSARDGSGSTPLHRAVQAGRFDVAARLLALGADGRAAATDGTTPLTLAAGDAEMEALIRRHGKD
jgi:ankyrin repeat protein